MREVVSSPSEALPMLLLTPQQLIDKLQSNVITPDME